MTFRKPAHKVLINEAARSDTDFKTMLDWIHANGLFMVTSIEFVPKAMEIEGLNYEQMVIQKIEQITPYISAWYFYDANKAVLFKLFFG